MTSYGSYPTFTQSRTANAVNETTGMTGGGFAATGYDASGNLNQGPKTGSESTVLRFTYDGWNRQAALDANNDGDLFDAGDFQYEYDGMSRRISKWQDTQTEGTGLADTSPDNDEGAGEEFYYNENMQTLEVRVATTTGGVKFIDPDPRERTLWDLTYVDSSGMMEIDTDLRTMSAPPDMRVIP